MNSLRPEDTGIREAVFRKIRSAETGAISWAEFMDLALYNLEGGYYADPASEKIGRAGDFFTSVSVGDCFGLLLGWEIERCWRDRLGSPDSMTLVEQGAHDGQLTADLLSSLAERRSPLAGKVRYRVIEPVESRRRQLGERFSGSAFGEVVEVVSSAGEIDEPCGLFFCNELLDAFPVHRVRFENGAWRELVVTLNEGECLVGATRDIGENSPLAPEVARMGSDFPEGYTTEFCLETGGWIRSVAPIFSQGIWWVIDYGFEDADYFAAHRTRGTLQCYRDHRVVEDPFEAPGDTDMTAHVNFSRLFREAGDIGLENTRFVDQHDFLIRAARPWLTGMEAEGTAQSPENRKRLRQFQTLTHPGMMGRVFKVAEFSRGL